MICPRCGRMNDEGIDYCAFCGASMGMRMDTGRLWPVADDRSFQTEVLTESFNDYLDTVVEPIVQFDPSVFQNDGTANGVSTSGSTNAPTNVPKNADTWVLGAKPASLEPTEVPLGAAPVARDMQPQYAPVPVQDTTSSSWAQAKSAAWSAPTRPLPNRFDDEDTKPNKLLIGIIVAAAVIGIVAVIVGLAISFGPRDSKSIVPIVVAQPSSSAAAPAVTEKSSDASNTAYSGESETVNSDGSITHNKGGSAVPQVEPGTGGRASDGMSDADAYKVLAKAYDAAADYDARVSDCASDFNALYKTGSESARQSKATVASSLKSQIRSDWKELENLDIPFWSKNIEAWEDLCLCYEYLYNRIDVIDRAWTIDLKYDNEKDIEKHESEILSPIQADNGAGGKNKYLTLFKELYPTIKLVKP